MLLFASLPLLTADLCCITCQQITEEVFSYPGGSLGLEQGLFFSENTVLEKLFWSVLTASLRTNKRLEPFPSGAGGPGYSP